MSRFNRFNRWMSVAAFGAICALGWSADGATPSYDDLPEIELAPPPKLDAMPKMIRGKEKVDGVFTALPGKQRYRRYGLAGSKRPGLFTSAEAAKAYTDNKLHKFKRENPENASPPYLTECFDVTRHWQLKSDRGWSNRLQRFPNVQGASRHSEAAKQSPDIVHPKAVRLERLTREGGKYGLSTVDFWFDADTMGARKIAANNITLKEVAQGPAGVRIFAARDKDDSSVHFYVWRPRHSDKRIDRTVSQHMRVSTANRHLSFSDCGHVHVQLQVTPGIGDQAAVELEVPLPEKNKKAKRKSRKKKPKSAEPEIEEVRVRTVRVQMGASQMTKDDKPVVTVSFRWKGAERRMQLF